MSEASIAEIVNMIGCSLEDVVKQLQSISDRVDKIEKPPVEPQLISIRDLQRKAQVLLEENTILQASLKAKSAECDKLRAKVIAVNQALDLD